MSFYNVKPTTKFVVQNDDNYNLQHVQFLNSGFQQSWGLDLPIQGDGFLTPNQLLNRYNVITQSSEYALPYAVDIITAIKAQQDVRALAQDSKAIFPSPGFYWDVCFSLPSDSELSFLLFSPNSIGETNPAEKGIVTISTCPELGPDFPVIFGMSGDNVWVRFTLVNLDATAGYLEVNASVLTNNCPFLLSPSPLKEKAVAMLENFKSKAQQSRKTRA
jgi:hypothetical protein